MSRRFTLRTIVACMAIALLVSLMLPTARSAEPEKIRVLLSYGGHGFQQGPFFAMFDAMEGIEYEKCPLPQSADRFAPGLEEDVDVVVMYDMVGQFTPEQQAAFLKLLKERGIGLVSLHHNLGAHRNWPEYTKIIGGKYVFKTEEIEGQTRTPSTYSHGEDLDIQVVDANHPITAGLEGFTIHDETYGNFFTSKNARILLKTDHPKNSPPILWVQQYGKSPVCYFMLGHDAAAWANPNFPKIVGRAIHWAAESSK